MLSETLSFSGGTEDRDLALRSDPEGLAAALAGGLVLPLWHGKPLAAADGARLGWLDAGHPALALGTSAIYLGRANDVPRFACDISAWEPATVTAPVEAGLPDASVQHHPDVPPEMGFAELRGLMTRLQPEDASLAATARALTSWHATHRFCAACGAASEVERGGWQRRCPSCAVTHFPRTDPVVIMLVLRGDRTLIGRSAGWPQGMYSCLAGYMEPGETLEMAVRREVAEETGVRVGRVTYVASQPWPFPSSLMLGCLAEAESDAITLDPEELEDARWIGRSEMAEVLAGSHPELRAPRRGAIARMLISDWVADRLGPR